MNSFLSNSQALVFGALFLSGIFLAATGHIAAIFCMIFLIAILICKKSLLYALGCALIAFMGYCYFSASYSLPPPEELPLFGKAYFSPSSVKLKSTSYGHQWIYTGMVHHFYADANEKHFSQIPTSISIPFNTPNHRYPIDHDYLLVGTLKMTNNGKPTFTPLKNVPWTQITDSQHLFGFSEMRFKLKTAFNRKINEIYKSKRSQTFLAGIATGDFNDRLLSFELGRYGLQHIMAISGFHFAVIAGFLSLLLRTIFSRAFAASGLIIALLMYFLFIGPTASVMRAWISCTVLLVSLAFGWRGNAINNLGLAATACLLFDPLQSLSIGFQFSFAATAGIIILFQPIDNGLQKLFSTRSISDVIKMNFIEQLGCCLLPYLRKSLSLMASVNLAALPLSLCCFGKFPLLSLVFNLVFPVLVSLILIMLLTGFLTGLIWEAAGNVLHSFNDRFTELTLTLVSDFPKNLDFTLYSNSINPLIVTIWLMALFSIGLFLQSREQEEVAWRWL